MQDLTPLFLLENQEQLTGRHMVKQKPGRKQK